MMARSAAILACLSAVVSASSQAHQSSAGVTSVSVRVIRKPVDAQFLQIENRRDVPLVEWRIELLSAENRGLLTAGRDYRGAFAWPEGPIAPRERRQERVLWRGERLAASVNVRLAVFADGSHAGSTEGIAEFRRQQEALIADLRYWHRALQEVPTTSAETARQYLLGKARERGEVDSSDPSYVRGSINAWTDPSHTADWLFKILTREVRQASERLEEATRYRKHMESDTAPERAVGVWIASGQGTNFVAVVENLRDTELEAVKVDVHDPAVPDTVANIGFDACTSLDDGSQAHGRLRRNGVWEMHAVSADGRSDSAAPRVVVRLALWKDLSWEGSSEERERLLEQRERKAELYAFWIAALKDATGKPAGEAIASLRQKRDERRRNAPDETDTVMGSNLDSALRLERDPETLVTWVDRTRATLERQHALLTRHVKR